MKTKSRAKLRVQEFLLEEWERKTQIAPIKSK